MHIKDVSFLISVSPFYLLAAVESILTLKLVSAIGCYQKRSFSCFQNIWDEHVFICSIKYILILKKSSGTSLIHEGSDICINATAPCEIIFTPKRTI